MEQAVNQKTSFDELQTSAAPHRSTLVRRANKSDLDFIVAQCEEFSKFYGTKKELFPGKEFASQGLLNIIENHVAFVSEVDGELSGFISGYFVEHPFNPKLKLLAENFYWVKQESRFGKSALKLLNAFVDFGQANSDWITFSLEHHSPMKEAALEKRGFKFQEKSFLRESV